VVKYIAEKQPENRIITITLFCKICGAITCCVVSEKNLSANLDCSCGQLVPTLTEAMIPGNRTRLNIFRMGGKKEEQKSFY